MIVIITTYHDFNTITILIVLNFVLYFVIFFDYYQLTQWHWYLTSIISIYLSYTK